jgi:hypothetical protein
MGRHLPGPRTIPTAAAGSFESGSWIDGTIGGFGVAMDALGVMTDPLGTLVSWGVAWLIEHLKPLSDALDWLAETRRDRRVRRNVATTSPASSPLWAASTATH